jgi:hypothetical protein
MSKDHRAVALIAAAMCLGVCRAGMDAQLLLTPLGKVGRDLTLTPGRLACSSHL